MTGSRFLQLAAGVATIAVVIPSVVLADALEGKKSSAEILAEATTDDWLRLPQENLLYITLERGVVVVSLSDHLAQSHVTQMKALAREGFYDGLSFYRVIDGFVAQGGDVLEKREIKTAKTTLKAAFDEAPPAWPDFRPLADEDGYASVTGFVGGLPVGLDEKRGRAWHLHCAGAIAMARGNEKDTAGTEFYVPLHPQRYLDRNLTVFGRVVQGMEHLQALRRVAPAESQDDDLGETIVSIRVGSDLPEAEQVSLETLAPNTDTFDNYVAARRNRPEAFFYYRPNHIDVCDLPVPVREQPVEETE